MRTEIEMLVLIQSIAEKDERIRAVILNGSRVNPNIAKDTYQDYDIIYLVNDLASFRGQPNWVDVFGERIIMQMPNDMQIDDEPITNSWKSITYLMLFKDTNRIDLTLVKVEHRSSYQDSLTKILLDKDHLFPNFPSPTEQDYWVKKPTEQQFLDCCNEFWWVSTYVVKGLLRQEITYAKEMMEQPVRNMFMQILAWQVGSKHDFRVNLGMCLKFLPKYSSPQLWDRVLLTYPDANPMNIWRSLIEMTHTFYELEVITAKRLGFKHNEIEAQNVKEYLAYREPEIIKLYDNY